MSERWVTSGPGRPCPVCGRSTDDKCRRSAGLVDCWVGSTFSPPAHLQLGDTITISGEPWALVSTAAGFGGNSYRFRPDRGRTVKPSRRAIRQQRQRQHDAALLTLELRRAMHRSLAALEPEHQLLDAFIADLDATAHAAALCEQLEATPRAELPITPTALSCWCKAINHQLRDLTHFDRHHLGTPTPAQINGLMGQTLKSQQQEVAA